jgi:hypothetical protein
MSLNSSQHPQLEAARRVWLSNALKDILMRVLTAPETNSKIHRQFRNAHEGHKSHAGLDPTRASTGVIWCTERAYEHGFLENPDEWANLGQGAPEVDDDIEGSFERPKEIDVSMTGREYGPTAGIKPLRAAVANLYNAHHRQGKASQYSWENVCIVPGGRAGLIRIAAVLNNAYLGFFIPDYTAYNEMLSLFKNVSLLMREINAAPLIGESWLCMWLTNPVRRNPIPAV